MAKFMFPFGSNKYVELAPKPGKGLLTQPEPVKAEEVCPRSAKFALTEPTSFVAVRSAVAHVPGVLLFTLSETKSLRLPVKSAR